MTGLVIAINETFLADLPVGAHEGVVVPFRKTPHAFSHKTALPDLKALHEKFCDVGSLFHNALPSYFVKLDLLILPLSVVLRHGGKFGHWFFERGLDKIGRKGHVKGAVEHHLMNVVKTNEAVVDHRAIGVFLTLAQPMLGADFHGLQAFCVKLAVGGDARFEDYFLRLDGSDD